MSQAFDTDSPLPRSTANHLRGCPRCREHRDVAVYLKKQGGQDSGLLAGEETRALKERILDEWPVSQLEQPSRRTFPWLPVSAAAAGLAAVALTVLLVIPSPRSGLADLNPLSEWDAVNSTLSTALDKVDSPYLREFENLKSSVNAAAAFFQNVMDVRIGDTE
jgi:hypothetical protein